MLRMRAAIRPYLTREYVFMALFVLAICFASTKLGQHLVLAFKTSPAIFWPQFGIALAAIYFGGFRMWLPVALAALLSIVDREASLAVLFAKTFGQTVQPILGAYALERLGFGGSVSRMRDVLAIFAVSLFASVVAPSLSLSIQWAVGPLADSFTLLWSRAWAGSVVSILLLFPLIAAWVGKREAFSRAQKFELTLASASLFAITTIVGFTTYTQILGFPLAYVPLAALAWFAVRLGPRATTTALFLASVLLIAGAITTYEGPLPLGDRLFQIELFLIFMGIIYLIPMALIEERRANALHIQKNMRDLEEALRRISADDRAKNEFIATLAHELRNPLSPVLSTLELLKMKNSDAATASLVESAMKQTHNMKRLLDDLLDVARIAQKKFKLKKELTDLRAVVAQSISSTEYLLKSRGHTLTQSLPEGPTVILADPVRLEQIFVNVLNNAIKYTNPGGHIEVSAVVERYSLAVTVKDNGIGIAQSELMKIWWPFRQSRETLEMSSGLGIGLSLTKRLVEMHGGTIEAQSEGLGKGSIFTIRLPRSTKQLPSAPSPESIQSFTEAFRVLIVDDNKAAAEAWLKLLELRGHTAMLAHSGSEALQSVDVFSPDIILLDLGLPDIDGYEVARQLRQMGSSTPLVALTGYGQEEDKMRTRNAGFAYHLTKPVGIRDLEGLFTKVKKSPRPSALTQSA